MTYEHILPAVFVDRPNRFVANVLIDGAPAICHVKNTGRCRELLTPGAQVYLQAQPSPARKTAYDLIAVRKGGLLINMDAAAPNRAVGEWLAAGGLGETPTCLRPEQRWGSSRFDFYAELGQRRMLLEVKGVTLEENGVARFPDAPTERGVKHLRELTACVDAGFAAAVVFVIQMKGPTLFEPNRATHSAFCDALLAAQRAGVRILAMDCLVTPETLTIDRPVPLHLTP